MSTLVTSLNYGITPKRTRKHEPQMEKDRVVRDSHHPKHVVRRGDWPSVLREKQITEEELQRYCVTLLEFHEWCSEHHVSFRAGMLIAIDHLMESK